MGTRRIRRWLAGLVRRSRFEREMSREMAHHLELEIQERITAGMSEKEARRTALRDFGGLERWKEESRAARGFSGWDAFCQNLNQALRMLLRSPGFAVAAILTLALGIAATVIIFAAVYSVLIKPLPYPQADRIFALWNSYGSTGLSRAPVSPAELADFREELKPFDAVAAMSARRLNLTGAGEPRQLVALEVSPNLFGLLGVRPLLGRDFRTREGRSRTSGVVILSYDQWVHGFGSDPGILGRRLRLDGRPVTVVGVLPSWVRFPEAPSFQFPGPPDLWLAVDWAGRRDEPRGNQYLDLVARARPSVAAPQIAKELDRLAAGFRRRFPDRYGPKTGWRPLAVPLREQIVGEVRPALLLLMSAVGLLLLIACANVAGLLLARAARRETEIALRAALGGSPGRIAVELLSESTLLGMCGFIAALPASILGLRLLSAFGPSNLPRLRDVHLDLPILAFAACTGLATALVAGIAPALRVRRANLALVLARRGRGIAAPGRLRRMLAAAEVAMAVVVLVGAGLLLRSFERLSSVNLGVGAPGVLTFRVSPPSNRYPGSPEILGLYERLLRRLRSLPGVEAAAAVYPLPLGGDNWSGSFFIPGRPVQPGNPGPHAEYSLVTDGYLRSLGIPLREGRDFDGRDGPKAPAVVLVDDLLAARYWPGQDAIGRQITLSDKGNRPPLTIIGVVGHVRRGGPRDAGEPQIYLPFAQHPFIRMSLVAKTSGDPAALLETVTGAVHAVDGDLPVADLVPLSVLQRDSMARSRFNLLLVAAFSAAGLLLACVGVYGTMTAAITSRRGEMGVRLALGGQVADLLRVVFAEAAAVAAPGLILGLFLAALLSRLAGSLLFQVKPADPMVYSAVTGLVAAAIMGAVWGPARRAARVDPVITLREV